MNITQKLNNYKTITIIDNIHLNPDGFSFEYSDTEVSIVNDEKGKRYLRVYKKECASAGNGRPITTISDDCYPLADIEDVTQQNWKKIMLSHLSESISIEHDSYCGV